MKWPGLATAMVLCAVCPACGSQAAAPATSRPSSRTTPTTDPAATTALPTTTTTPPPTAPPGAEVTVSPTTAGIGQTIIVSGTGCTPNFGGEASVVIGQGDAYSNQGTEGTVAANSEGSWSMPLVLARSTPVGPRPVMTACGSPPPTTDGYFSSQFNYPTSPTLDITTTYSVTVSPGSTVGAGATLDVASEAECPDPGGGLHAWVGIGPDASYDNNGPSPDFVGIIATPDDLGNWSTALTIPATTDPGTYWLNASCVVGYAQNVAYYSSVSITVVAS